MTQFVATLYDHDDKIIVQHTLDDDNWIDAIGRLWWTLVEGDRKTIEKGCQYLSVERFR